MRDALLKISMAKGVDTLNDPRRISDDSLVNAQNVLPVLPGVVSLRPGLFAQQLLFPAPPTQLIIPNLLPGSMQILAGTPATTTLASPAFVAVIPTSAGHTQAFLLDNAGNTLLSVDWNAQQTYKLPILVYNGQVYVFAASGPNVDPNTPTVGGVILTTQDGPPTNFADLFPKPFVFQGQGNSLLTPRVAAVYLNRAVFANFGPGFESTVTIADENDPTKVGNNITASNGWSFAVQAEDRDEIVALKEVMLTAVGTPTQSGLLILKHNSGFLLTGSPNLTTSGSTLIAGSNAALQKFSFRVGCASPDTIVTTPYGTLWADHNNVWLLRDGAAPYPVGKKIRSRLRNSAPGQRWMWHAAYYNGFYRLAIYSPSAVQSSNGAPGPCDEQWWLDLRDGAPVATKYGDAEDNAQWWGPHVYYGDLSGSLGTFAMCQETRQELSQTAYAVTNSAYLCELDAANNARDYPVPVALDTLHSDDPVGAVAPRSYTGCEILADLRSKDYDGEDPEIRKIFRGVELNLRNWLDTQVNVEVLCNQTSIETDSQPFAEQSAAQFTLDVSALDTGSMAAQTQSFAIRPANGGRPQGFNVQVHLTNVPGYVINSTNDQLIIKMFDGVHNLAFPHGVYTATQLMAALITLLNSLSLGTFAGALSGDFWQITHTSTTWAYGDAFGLVPSKIWLLLGFDADDQTASLSKTATASVFPLSNSQFEIGGLNLQLRPIPKRPNNV